MTLYNYNCANCQHNFEESLKMDDRKLPETLPCPNCKAEKTVQISIGASNVIVDATRLNFRKKMDPKLKDRLQEIKASHPGNKIDL